MNTRLLFLLFSFCILYACNSSSESPDTEDPSTVVAKFTDPPADRSQVEPEQKQGVTPQPIQPKAITPKPVNPDRIPKPVQQAPKSDLVFPESFKEFEIPKYKGATIVNNLILENSKGKFGQRLRMDCPGEMDEVYKFYDQALKDNDWQRLTERDQLKEDADFIYRSLLYTKGDYSFSMILTDIRNGKVGADMILKEI